MTEQMGHGVKQRDLVKMTPEEVDAFIHERRPMSMCSINHDGSIHAVAMWYGFLEGAVAVETALKKPARAIILEAPFLSIPRMAKTIYPFLPSFLVRTKFDNEAKIGRVGIPKLIVAAENDDVVPPQQARRLFELAREPKQFYVIRGAAHNNTYIVGGREYLEVWRGFLK